MDLSLSSIYITKGGRYNVFTILGSLQVGSDLVPYLIVPHSLTLEKAYARIQVAPVDADILIDINKNGTSIWSSTPANRLTISDGANTGTQTSFDTTTLAESDYLTLDIDQIGSTTAGTRLTVELKCS